MLPYWVQFDAHNLAAIKDICRKFGTETENEIVETEVPSYYSSDKSNISGPPHLIRFLILPATQAIQYSLRKLQILFVKYWKQFI